MSEHVSAAKTHLLSIPKREGALTKLPRGAAAASLPPHHTKRATTSRREGEKEKR